MATRHLPQLPSESDQFNRIVETIIRADVADIYERLEPQLKIENALEPQAIRAALNVADNNALQAHRAYVAAKYEFEMRDLALDRIEAQMREDAISELSSDKAMGNHAKAITEADVKAKMATMYPDEYSSLVTARKRADATLKHLERFADRFQSRVYALKSLNDH